MQGALIEAMGVRGIEGAAIDGFPHDHVRFMGACESGDENYALGLILLNPDATPYPMMVWLERVGEEWSGIQATELIGGVNTVFDDTIGRWVTWAVGRAPDGAKHAILRKGDDSVVSNVRDGWYVVAAWGSSSDGAERLTFD